MTSPTCDPLGELTKPGYRPRQPKADDSVWCLNLDQIEPHSGRILERLRKGVGELGPSTHAFEAGTVLYSKLRPYLNKVVVADQDGVATTELVPIRCDESRLDAAYLGHFLRGPDFVRFATNVVSGAKMPRMVMSEFWSYPVPLPPVPEQRRIAAILDQADALSAKRREVLAQLDNLAQSIFVEMFGDPVINERGWPETTVSEFVAAFETGKSLVADDEDAISEFRVLKVSAVTSFEFKPEQSKALPADYDPPASHFVRHGDLLFSRANTAELIGATALVSEAHSNLVLPDKLWRFVWPKVQRSTPLFVHHLFRQQKFRLEIAQRASGTSGSMKNISQEKVLSIRIGLPPIDLQESFANRQRAIESLKTTHRAALTESNTLFAALQHRAFSGAL